MRDGFVCKTISKFLETFFFSLTTFTMNPQIEMWRVGVWTFARGQYIHEATNLVFILLLGPRLSLWRRVFTLLMCTVGVFTMFSRVPLCCLSQFYLLFYQCFTHSLSSFSCVPSSSFCFIFLLRQRTLTLL